MPVLSSNLDGNLHMSALKLREHLVLVGLGGCVQDYVKKAGEDELKPCWDPFPYKDPDHRDFNEDLDELW